eukprot:4021040-Pleurochrysis_carterae.AAC.1
MDATLREKLKCTGGGAGMSAWSEGRLRERCRSSLARMGLGVHARKGPRCACEEEKAQVKEVARQAPLARSYASDTRMKMAGPIRVVSQ